jgi:formylglycine-generating enzyme required for sulfatase activity
MRLTGIPPGEFLMGSPDSDNDAEPDEKPRHKVQITRPFYLAIHEVTQAQFRAVTGANPSSFKGSDDRPVEMVSWLEAVEFCNSLSVKERLWPYYLIDGRGDNHRVVITDQNGTGYRLPTEAEWEYSCRAGSTTRFIFGDDAAPLGEFAWYAANPGPTYPVGQKRPNSWGLHDMNGNVWEWCWDRYTRNSDRQSAAADPSATTGPSELRVIRGGSWGEPAPRCRSASRDFNRSVQRGDYLGFRVARGVPSDEIINSIGMKLKLIPAGAFLMGSPEGEKNAVPDEQPQHPVRISRPFYLGVHEVTQGQYRVIAGKNPSHFKGSDDLPVDSVSWNDAIAFCNTLSEREGLRPYYQNQVVPQPGGEGYRLPTEAEWEYACRAGSATLYCFGDKVASLGEFAWYEGNSGNTTHPVGRKQPNAIGLYDMHGNAYEWCWDWYDGGFYGQLPAVDPRGPSQSSERVLRGGGWNGDASSCFSARRVRHPPEWGDAALGFRVARGQLAH